jgi:hypothetical protein
MEKVKIHFSQKLSLLLIEGEATVFIVIISQEFG